VNGLDPHQADVAAQGALFIMSWSRDCPPDSGCVDRVLPLERITGALQTVVADHHPADSGSQ
jgi:hypothetical protein